MLAGELTTLAERPPADRYGRVFVGTIEQARGRSFEVVFVPGLAERMFPQKPREDPILLDSLRRDLGRAPRDAGRPGPSRAPAAPARRRRRAPAPAPLVLAHRADARRARGCRRSTRSRWRARSRARCRSRSGWSARRRPPAGARLAWPAPDDPARAIDEVEHDLATLRGLLASGEARGRARYLLELNDCLARSLRTRWSRWHPQLHAGRRRGARDRRHPRDAGRRPARGARPTRPRRSRSSRRARTSSSSRRSTGSSRARRWRRSCSSIRRRAATCSTACRPTRCGRSPPRAACRSRPTASSRRERRSTGRSTGSPSEYREELAPAILRVWQDEIESMRADLRMWLEQSAATRRSGSRSPSSWRSACRAIRRTIRAACHGRGDAAGGLPAARHRRSGRAQRDGADLRVTDHKTGRNYTQAEPGRRRRRDAPAGALRAGGRARCWRHGVVRGAPLLLHARGGFAERVVPLTERRARPRARRCSSIIDRAIERGLPAARAARAARAMLRLPRRLRPARGDAHRAARTQRASGRAARAEERWP